jgi:translocator assembly and maintenance protein 41
VQTYSLSKIYQQIASISYAGDLRVSVGAEDPLKIQKLVHSDGQFDRWNDLYKDSLDMLTSSGILSLFDDDYVECNLNESSRDELLKRVPLQVRRKGHVLELRQLLASIVAPAARNQTMKGVVTAGPVKSAIYALNKLKKGILKSK